MLRALGGFLNDRDFLAMGSLPASLEFAAKPMMSLINAMPDRAREFVYTWSGAREAIPPERAG
jgi:hypothetical protein